MQLKPCQEAGVMWELTDLRETVGFHIQMGEYVCWNKINTMFAGQI